VQVQQLAFQMLEGLDQMHENDFAHRDLKPGVCKIP
jgi:serine/threonine protein kinase